MRDNQKSKVYGWERQFQNSHFIDIKSGNERCHDELTLKECERLVKTVCRYFKVTRIPSVTDGRGCRSAYWFSHWEIKLPKWARQETVVLHELAHMITPMLFRRVAPHGREFVGVQMSLLNRYMDIPYDVLMETARNHRVDFISQQSYKDARRNYIRSK